MARRLPVLSAYERRIAELTAEVERFAAERSRTWNFRPPGHYYSPDPDLEQLTTRRDRLFTRDATVVPGIELSWEAQLRLLDELAPLVADVPFGDEGRQDLRYRFDNGSYAFGDGLFLHLMLRWLRPARFIEVGSGHSSACALDTAERFLGNSTRCTFIEPYDELLRSLLRAGDEERVEILSQAVQDVPIERFTELEQGDLLLIDSTHVSKLGSDVNHLLFEVLPRLAPGVVVHLHDIFPGFDYPWEWHEEGRVWTEAYLLRAFLQFNSAYDVLLWPPLIAAAAPDLLVDRFAVAQENPGGSIYLRRRC
jgi:hypothetical protein